MKKETRRLIVRTFLFALYLATGMVVFRLLESENETIERLKAQEDIEIMRRKFNVSVLEMQEFVDIIQRAASYGFLSNWVEKWSYTGSLFFSGTVITTIGKYMQFTHKRSTHYYVYLTRERALRYSVTSNRQPRPRTITRCRQ